MPSPSRRGEFLLLLASTLLALVAAEAIVRGLGLAEKQPTGYAPVDTMREGAEPTNSGGYRDLERSPAKPRGVRRVVSLGDSFAWGVGVEFEDAYPQRIERALKRRGETWEVVNLALRGMNTVHHARQLEQTGLSYAPDVVVLGYTMNDAEDEQAQFERQALYMKEREQRRAERRRRRAEAKPLLDRSALLRLVRTRLEATGANRRSIREYLDMYADDAPGWIAAREAFQRMAGICRERGIPFVVLVFPKFALPSVGMSLDEGYPFASIHAKVGRAAREAGARVVDLFPEYRGLRWEVLVVDGVNDEHPNEIAHRIAAAALLNALDEVAPRRDSVPGRR